MSQHELPEVQRAVRLLLRHPLVAGVRHDDFLLVRRWETLLANELKMKFGYQLVVGRSAARLLRRPSMLSRQRGARVEQSTKSKLLNRWGYAYLALILAALDNLRGQALASELLQAVEQIARGNDAVSLDRSEPIQRTALIDALRYLTQLGVLSEVDGTVDSIRSDTLTGEVLFDIDHDAAAMCLVASPSVLRNVDSVMDFLAEPTPSTSEGHARLARQRLNRRIIDMPVVFASGISDSEAELAWRNRRREAENVARLTGCQVEVRSEGIALIDSPITPTGRTRFPGSGTESHAALLWLDALVGSAQSDAAVDAGAEEFRTVSAQDADGAWESMFTEYGSRFNRKGRENPERLQASCRSILAEHGLIRVGVDGSVMVSAAAARYRAEAKMIGKGSP